MNNRSNMDYFKRVRVKDILAGEKDGQDVLVMGWVRTKRASKNVIFLEINDGSSLANIQAVFLPPENFPQLEEILTGASVKLSGTAVAVEGRKHTHEISGKEIEILGECDPSYPLQKKRHSFEFLREIAHLRPRTNTFGVMNRFRSKLSYGVHKFFQERDFYYIHTPIITTTDCEGAGELFTVTTFDIEKIAKGQEANYADDFFAERAGLTVSGQLEGELLCSALGDIYTFGPTFRAEQSNTYRHLSEFWMIEPEMAFCNLEEMMVLIQDFLKFLIQYSLEECSEEMNFFNAWIDKGRRQLLIDLLNSEFVIVTYTEAVEILQKAKVSFDYPVTWGVDLQSEHERYLTEQYFKKPAFVIDYPKDIKAFYMRVNDDGKTVRAVDVLVPGVGEIVGGSQREERYDKLRENMESKGIAPADYEWFLDIRRYGTIPHSGFGLGFARMLMYLSGMANIRDVVPFPRTPRHAKF